MSKDYAEPSPALIAAAPELLDFVKTLENDDECIPVWLWTWRNELIKRTEDK